MRRTFRAVASVAALALAVTACGGGNDDGADAGDLDLVTAGTLTVCTESPYEPFEFEDPDSPIGYSGFDMDLVVAIAETMDLEVSIVNTGFEGLTSGATMAAGTCDMAASAMTITDERAESIDFSDPYYASIQSLLVPSGSDITSIDDLGAGLQVGVQSGTTGEEFANENVTAGAEIRSFEGGGDLFTALEAGQIDAILQDEPVNGAYAANNDVEIVETFDTGENYGFAFEKDRGDGLVAAVNAGLAEVRDSGLYDELFDQYFAVID